MTTEHQTLALILFSLFIAVTLGITTWVSRNRHGSAEEFYAGGRLFSPWRTVSPSPATTCPQPPSSASPA